MDDDDTAGDMVYIVLLNWRWLLVVRLAVHLLPRINYEQRFGNYCGYSMVACLTGLTAGFLSKERVGWEFNVRVCIDRAATTLRTIPTHVAFGLRQKSRVRFEFASHTSINGRHVESTPHHIKPLAMRRLPLIYLGLPLGGCPFSHAFKSANFQSSAVHASLRRHESCVVRLASNDDSSSQITSSVDSVEKRFTAASAEKSEILITAGEQTTKDDATSTKAVTSSVNDRLMSEIQASVEKEKYGSSKARDYFKEFRSQKSEEERQRSIEEARDLNGLNPLVCIGGAAFAWACAGALWFFTTYLGALFASHPFETDVYFIQRLTQVFRNVVMGLSSLASGFFGVIGVGIFLLGVRVGYGVMTGELDPTPIKKSKSEEIVLPDVWGLMTGKSNRRGKR